MNGQRCRSARTNPRLILPEGLKLFSNRGYCRNVDGFIYVFARNVLEAERLVKAVAQPDGAWFGVEWAIDMEGIKPETGVWFIPFEHWGGQGIRPKRIK